MPELASRRVFVLGALVAVAAVSPPVDAVADRHLAAHMAQHLVLGLVAPPLLAVSLPAPRRWWPAVLGASIAVSTAALLAWHVPAAYDAAVDHAPLHALEHLAFLLTAVVLWVGAVGAVRAGAWPAALLGLFVASLPPTGLGVALTLARTPWYAPYADGADPVGAQQLAGVVMWGAGGVLAVATAVALVLVALRGAERTAPERVTVAPPPPTVRPATPLGTPHPDGMAGRS